MGFVGHCRRVEGVHYFDSDSLDVVYGDGLGAEGRVGWSGEEGGVPSGEATPEVGD